MIKPNALSAIFNSSPLLVGRMERMRRELGNVCASGLFSCFHGFAPNETNTRFVPVRCTRGAASWESQERLKVSVLSETLSS